MVTRSKQTFFQRRYTGGQQVYEKMFNILIIKAIKPTRKHHLTPVRMSIIQKKKTKKYVGEDVEKREPLYNFVCLPKQSDLGFLLKILSADGFSGVIQQIQFSKVTSLSSLILSSTIFNSYFAFLLYSVCCCCC